MCLCIPTVLHLFTLATKQHPWAFYIKMVREYVCVYICILQRPRRYGQLWIILHFCPYHIHQILKHKMDYSDRLLTWLLLLLSSSASLQVYKCILPQRSSHNCRLLISLSLTLFSVVSSFLAPWVRWIVCGWHLKFQAFMGFGQYEIMFEILKHFGLKPMCSCMLSHQAYPYRC